MPEQSEFCNDPRTASFSFSNGACVEVATRKSGGVGVRDTVQASDPGRVTLAVPEAAWRSFTGRLRAAS